MAAREMLGDRAPLRRRFGVRPRVLAKVGAFAAYSVGLVCWRGIGEYAGLLERPEGPAYARSLLGSAVRDSSAVEIDGATETPFVVTLGEQDGEMTLDGSADVAVGVAAGRALVSVDDVHTFTYADSGLIFPVASWTPAKQLCSSMAVTYAALPGEDAPYVRSFDCAAFDAADACDFLRETFNVECKQWAPGSGSGIYNGYMVEIWTPPAKQDMPYYCESYLLLAGSNLWSREGRIVLYLVALLYTFLGVAIVADVFMNAIEVITSKEKTINVKDSKGNPTGRTRTYLVWNGTVANLTLMALGSSAPEILLSLMETLLTLEEVPGELGPSTIVGSAAFNLLIISGVCVTAPKDGEITRVEHYGVFSITSFFSIWAYLWLYIVLAVWSKDEVTLVEACITVAHFPVLVGLAYGADVGWRFLPGRRGEDAVPSEVGTSSTSLEAQIDALEDGSAAKAAADRRVQFAEGGDTEGEEEHRNNYLTYRSNAVRFLSGGARIRLVAMMSMKLTAPLHLPDEDKLRPEPLPETNAKGLSSDPYVKVKFGKQRSQTEHVMRNINPVYMDVLTFKGKNMSLPIEFAVWDHDHLSADDYMCGGVIKDTAEILATTVQAERWVDLLDERKNPAGRLHVMIRRINSVMDEPPRVDIGIVQALDLPGLERAGGGDGIAEAVGKCLSASKAWIGGRMSAWCENNEAWIDQFKNALMLHGDLDDDGRTELPPEPIDFVMHGLTIFWKLLFAIIPPPEYKGGWVCFVVSLTTIGMVTFVVGELAGLFGCVVGLKDSVTAITFVALGTSLPDTFASKMAAENEPTADNSLGNITGSNAVNVFLGIGLPWLVATAYKEAKYGIAHAQPAGALGISLAAFIGCALVCLAWLYVRRRTIGGELGGPKGPAGMFAKGMGVLWMVYILISALKAYKYF